ncbi:MAG: CD225/dispanin family protein [Fimbriimonadaceae bacterium]
MEYFVFDVNGNQYGPARIDEINAWVKEGRIDPSMQVMQVGTTFRYPITQLAGVIFPSPTMNQNPQPPLQGAGSQYSSGFGGGYGNPQPSAGYGNYPRASHAPVDNHLIKAIFCTLCCCLPIGVVSIVYAAQVDGHVRRGDYMSAQNAAATADTWANWSIGLGLVGMCLNLATTLPGMMAR